MAFNRMWNFVSGWSPFKTQTRLNMDMDPAMTILRQEYNAVIGSLKPEDGKKVEKLLQSTCDDLKRQFSAKQQYRGDSIHGIIDKHLQVLAGKEANVSAQTIKQTSSNKPLSTATVQETSGTKSVTDLTKKEENVFTDIEVPVKISSQGATGQAKSQPAQKVDTTSSISSGKEATSTTGLSEADISNALDAFEFSLTGKVGDQPLADTKDVEVKEEELKPGKAVVTGFRGNPYYEEELRKAVDNSMSGDGKDVKPASGPAGKPATDLPKAVDISAKPATDASDGLTKPASKPSELKPQQPTTSSSSSTDKQQKTPEKSSMGLSKEEINKSLDIFESSLSEEIPEFESNIGSDDAEVMHVAKAQSTGSGRPAAAAGEEKVVKASLSGGATALSKDEITSALDAFEAGLGGSLNTNVIAETLVADVRDGKNKEAKETVKEELLKPDKAVRTGGRGNPYYEEELRKAVDDSMANEAKPVTKPVAAATDASKDPAGTAPTVGPTATTTAATAGQNAKPAAAAVTAPVIQPAAAAAASSTAKPAAATPATASHKEDAKQEKPKTTDEHHKPAIEVKDSLATGKEESKPSGEPTEKKLKPEGDSSEGVTKPTDKKPLTDGTSEKPTLAETPKPGANQ